MEPTTAVSTKADPLLDNVTDITSRVIGTNSTTDIMPTMMNNYTNGTEQVEVSMAFLAFYFVMRFAFSAFSLFGNTLTITAVAQFEKLQSKSNVLICSLAVADIIGCMTLLLDVAQEMLSNQPIFVPLCLTHRILGAIATSMNIVSIFGIAIDRYIFIAHPLKYPLWVSSIKFYTILALSWVYQVTVITVLITTNHHLTVGVACKYSYMLSKLAYVILVVPLLVFIALTVPFHVAIGRIAYKQGKAIAILNQPYDTYEASMNRQQKKIAKMIGTVLGVYLACYVPQLLGIIVHRFASTYLWLHFDKLAVLIYWLNIFLNPLIYALKSEDFREAFRKLLHLKQSTPVHPINLG